jgi:hypothetical protein
MGLEKLAQLGWYKAEPTSAKEIADLFSIVDRSQADSRMEGISDDLRFQAAYNGILTLANIALRASGFRVSLGQGRHQPVIESLFRCSAAGLRNHGRDDLRTNSTDRRSSGVDCGVGKRPKSRTLKVVPVLGRTRGVVAQFSLLKS